MIVKPDHQVKLDDFDIGGENEDGSGKMKVVRGTLFKKIYCRD